MAKRRKERSLVIGMNPEVKAMESNLFKMAFQIPVDWKAAGKEPVKSEKS